MRGVPLKGPALTPERLQLPKPLRDDAEPGDGSPLRRRRGLSGNASGSPVLSSSFAPEEGSALLTPAPVRKHPHLAPPSTAQRPSQHMPTSSPAPFWRFADLGNTPSVIKAAGGGGYDVSPLRGLGGDVPQSSSPAPRRTRDSVSQEAGQVKGEEEESEGDEPAFDLTR